MGQEVEGDCLGDEYKGYVFKITGGNDKDGFPMRQGVMVKVIWLISGPSETPFGQRSEMLQSQENRRESQKIHQRMHSGP